MSLIESITRGAIGFRADINGSPPPWDDYWYQPLGSASSTGMRITPETSKRIAAVLACVGILSKNIGMMPFKIYTETSNGGKKVVDHHPLYDVLYSQPNSQQTAFEWKQMMEGHLELRGNAYSEIIPGPRGAVDQLIPMHPDRVTVERLKPTGRLRYVYNDPLTDKTRNLMQEEVFHLRNFSDNGAVGQSTVAMASDTFGVALAAQDYSARFFRNDARPTGVIEGANFKTKQDEEQFRESWQQAQTGANRHKTAILPPGLSYKAIGISPNDAQILDARKYSRIEICSIFGVPPHLIGETEKTATYASVEQFNIMFAVQAVLPRLILWEQAIQRDLIQNPRYFAKASMSALLRGDTASRFAAYQIAIQNGWMSQNDVRLLEDLNPIPDGNTYWRPAAWIPLGQINQPAALPVPENAASVDDSDPSADDSAGDGEQAVQKQRLMLLASSAADRCMRREINGARKLVERSANNYQIYEFYGEQERFTVEALRLSPESASVVRGQCRARAEVLDGFLLGGHKGEAFDWIDGLAVAESLRLSTLAVEGVR